MFSTLFYDYIIFMFFVHLFINYVILTLRNVVNINLIQNIQMT